MDAAQWKSACDEATTVGEAKAAEYEAAQSEADKQLQAVKVRPRARLQLLSLRWAKGAHAA